MVFLRLHLKPFDSVITHTISLNVLTCPLTSNQLHQVELMRNRMLPSIVGCAPWWTMMGMPSSRKWLKNKNVHSKFSMLNLWLRGRWLGDFRFAAKISFGRNSWTSGTSEWYPSQRSHVNYWAKPLGQSGRPAKRWDDQMESFVQEIFHSSWFQAANYETWSSHEEFFVQWCLERWCLAAIIFDVLRGP